ncbi:hypothetical protein DZC52_14455 [Wenzhouxiangella sediminis]|uniref:Uncharacterized protein n=1 Tax=Wenzhouxiangella sediminis TaxID=1792836 RepID=A0A3E1K5W7_9GAMM|nr:hypothetical protein DZC52_14455 [Wenzhouxiangella sediminis]
MLLALTFLLVGQASATGEINVLTDLKSPFPPGCVAVSLPQGPAPGGDELFNETIAVPSVNASQPAAQVRVRIWRTGCHDEGYSVVMVRLRKVSGGRVLVPRVFAEAGEVDVPDHMAQLIRHPAVGNVGASGNEIGEQGITYMLGVDPFSIDGETEFWPEDYNGLFTLDMYWGDYSGSDESHYVLFSIPEYVPEFDPPQNAFPTLHGRMSGQYTVEGLPYSGLVLQIGEQYNPNGPDTNNVTAIFFTYFNGAPFWVLGAATELEPGFDIVTLDMLEFAGGEFITSNPGSYDPGDVDIDSIGTMTIEALDCNTLLVGYNFSEGGLGAGQFEATRLLRMAGYDCNPWQ